MSGDLVVVKIVKMSNALAPRTNGKSGEKFTLTLYDWKNRVSGCLGNALLRAITIYLRHTASVF
jgi:hypothetical protein